jgi:hypothetical protein
VPEARTIIVAEPDGDADDDDADDDDAGDDDDGGAA